MERLAGGRGILLTRSGLFQEVWLGLGPGGPVPGVEVEGWAVPRALVWLGPLLAGPRRALVAAGAACAAAAVVGALYGGWKLPGPWQVWRGPAWAVPQAVDAGSVPAPVVKVPLAPQQGAAATALSEQLEAPRRLTIRWEPGEWASIRLTLDSADQKRPGSGSREAGPWSGEEPAPEGLPQGAPRLSVPFLAAHDLAVPAAAP